MVSNRDITRPIYLLDSKHTMSLILYLDEAGPSRRMEIYDHVSRNMSIPEKINLLLDRGILSEIFTPEGTKLSLTPAGTQIAGCLKVIENILDSTEWASGV